MTGRAIARAAVGALALVPIGIAAARWVPLYIAPADDIWYQYRSIGLALVDLPVILVALAWLMRRERPHPGAWLASAGLFALAAAAAASAPAGIHPALAIGLTAQLAILGIFALATASLASRAGEVGLRVVCIVLAGEAAIGILQVATGSTWPAGLLNGWDRELSAPDVGASVAALPGVDRWLRGYGTFPHPNALGIFSAVALVVILTSRSTAQRWRAAGVAAALLALMLSLSRTGWLGAGLGVVTWVLAAGRDSWLRPDRRIPTATLVAIVLIGGAAVAGARFARLDTPLERGSIDERQLENDAALAIIARGAPVGAGSIVIAEQTVRPTLGEPVHNVFLIALAEMGWSGVVALLALFAALGALAWRGRADPLGRAAPLVLAAALVPLLSLDHFLWTQAEGRALLAWAVGVVAGSATLRESPSDAGEIDLVKVPPRIR